MEQGENCIVGKKERMAEERGAGGKEERREGGVGGRREGGRRKEGRRVDRSSMGRYEEHQVLRDRIGFTQTQNLHLVFGLGVFCLSSSSPIFLSNSLSLSLSHETEEKDDINCKVLFEKHTSIHVFLYYSLRAAHHSLHYLTYSYVPKA